MKIMDFPRSACGKKAHHFAKGNQKLFTQIGLFAHKMLDEEDEKDDVVIMIM
jgi:hypothetical protein